MSRNQWNFPRKDGKLGRPATPVDPASQAHGKTGAVACETCIEGPWVHVEGNVYVCASCGITRTDQSDKVLPLAAAPAAEAAAPAPARAVGAVPIQWPPFTELPDGTVDWVMHSVGLPRHDMGDIEALRKLVQAACAETVARFPDPRYAAPSHPAPAVPDARSISDLQARFDKLIADEHALSDSYVRIRQMVGAMSPPSVTDSTALYAYVEDAVRAALATSRTHGKSGPMTQAPELGAPFWHAAPVYGVSGCMKWNGGAADRQWLAEGRAFHTEADARAALAAQAQPTTQGTDTGTDGSGEGGAHHAA